MKILRTAIILFLLLVLSAPMSSADPPDPPHPGPAMFEDFRDCWVFDDRGSWIDEAWFYI